MPYELTIQAIALKKMIKQLQLVEQKQELFTIDGLLPSQFLLCAIQTNEEEKSLKNRVKTILLHLAGDFETQSEDLSDKLHLKTNLLFKETQYKLLFLKLNALLQHYQPEKRISIKEIEDCQTVMDCFILIEKNN